MDINLTSLKFITLSFLMLLMISGCDEREIPSTSKKITNYPTRCIDNVVYLLLDRGVTVAFNADGTVKTCGK